MAHTNSIESFWAALKWRYHGVYYRMSEKHFDRYVVKFSGRHNDRTKNTADQTAHVVKGIDGKRFTYDRLVA